MEKHASELEKTLFVTFTMDCEREARFSPPGGPKDWDLSFRAIDGFARRLRSHGQAATFFVVPENAREHTSLWGDLATQGFELGMHLHPESFRDNRLTRCLGGYSSERQKELLGAARDDWSNALHREPVSFRGGNFSASDATFSVLHDLGFRQGSVSAPGRVRPELRAVWAGTPRFAHYVDPAFRLIEGTLDFLEVPVTVDPARAMWNGTSAFELRIEWGNADEHLLTVRRAIEAMIEQNVPVKAVASITHNYFEYGDDNDPCSQAVDGLCRGLAACAASFGLDVKPITLRELHLLVDRNGALDTPGDADADAGDAAR